MCVGALLYGGQKTTFKIWFSPSLLALGIELRLLGFLGKHFDP